MEQSQRESSNTPLKKRRRQLLYICKKQGEKSCLGQLQSQGLDRPLAFEPCSVITAWEFTMLDTPGTVILLALYHVKDSAMPGHL